MRRIRYAAVLATALLLGWLLAVPSSAAEPRQAGCQGNLLANPNFEGGSRKTEGEGTSLSSAVSDGWFPWFVRGSETVNREPEFKVEQVAIGGDPYRIRSGGQSMKWFTTWATHSAGIYQRAAAPRGAQVAFSIHAMAYSGEGDGWNEELGTHLSDRDRPGNYRLLVGIDPTGALPSGVGAPPPPSVVWSAPSMTVDQWVFLSVSAVAQAGVVTVYTKGAPEFAVKHNDSFWDDACLVVTGGGQAAATGSRSPEPTPFWPARPGPAPHLRTGRAIPL